MPSTEDATCEEARRLSEERRGALVTVFEVRTYGQGCRARTYVLRQDDRPALVIEPGRWLYPILTYHLGKARHPFLLTSPFNEGLRGKVSPLRSRRREQKPFTLGVIGP